MAPQVTAPNVARNDNCLSTLLCGSGAALDPTYTHRGSLFGLKSLNLLHLGRGGIENLTGESVSIGP